MSTEDLLEVVKLLRREMEQIDTKRPRGAKDLFQLGRVAGLDLALTLIDDYFGPELDDERRAQEEELKEEEEA